MNQVSFAGSIGSGTVILFPGGFLDPDYGSNNKIWLCRGTINSMTGTLTPPGGSVAVYDCQEKAAGFDQGLSSIVLAGAAALRAPLDSAGNVFEVHSPLSASTAVPAIVDLDQSRKVDMPLLGGYEMRQQLQCTYGMMVVLSDPGVYRMTIEYEPSMTGPAVYKASQAENARYMF